MTSPGNPPIIPQRGYTASTIYQLQDVDPDALGRGANADMHGELEGVRGNLFNGLLGGFTSVPAALVPIINGIFNGWFGGGGVGDPLQVQYTIEAIKDAIINGYNVETKVTSGTWTKPEALNELIVTVVGAGQNGSSAILAGAPGGLGGGFVAQAIDPASVADETSYVVGTNGGTTSFGSHVVSAAGTGGISTTLGFTATSSMPGTGGTGGAGNNPGTRGESTPLATGGAGGSPRQHGAAGGNVSPATTTKCGGAGGGGGGGTSNAGSDAGSGGPGGYPGGGGGGAGYTNATSFSSNGAIGLGATGILWIFWR